MIFNLQVRPMGIVGEGLFLLAKCMMKLTHRLIFIVTCSMLCTLFYIVISVH